MPTKVFYQVHRKSLLQKQRDFYENNKEMIKEQARIKYYSLSPEEKNKKSEYAKNWYNNLPEDKRNVKREYAKNKYHNMTDEEMQKHKKYQKKYQKIYQENKKRRQGNFDKNVVLNPQKH